MDCPMDRMDRVDRDTISSAVTVKTDTGSKVLPGDKRGLPYEIWAIILNYLNVEDLCRSAMVCKTWNEVVQSLDHTKWRELYLNSNEWRHPYWPLNLHSDPHSWRVAYKEQYLAKKFWTQIDRRQSSTVTCTTVFKKTKIRKTITVGVGKEYETLKAALAVANDFDKILVYPGIYDEQFEMSSKIPFEMIGVGELGSVILVVCIEQTAITGRINNLVFRAPWFTNFILKVRSGFLQVDNCIMEDGMVYVQNPGSVTMNFCTFRHATIILQHVNASIIQNCEFSQTDSAAITVEGYPKEEKNWTFKGLHTKIMSLCTLKKKPERQKSGESMNPKSAFSLSTATSNQKSGNKALFQRQFSMDTELQRKMSHDFDLQSHDPDRKIPQMAAFGGASGQKPFHGGHSPSASNNSHNSLEEDHPSLPDNGQDFHRITDGKMHGSKTSSKCDKTLYSTQSLGDGAHGSKHHKEKIKRIESFVTDCAKYGSSNPGTARDTDGEASDHSVDLDLFNSRPCEGHLHTKVSTRDVFLNKDKALFDSDESDNESDMNENNSQAKIPPLDLHSLVSPNSHSLAQKADSHDLPHDIEGVPALVARDGVGHELGHHRERSLSSSELSLHSLHTASSNDVASEEEQQGGDYNSDGHASSMSTSSSDDDELMMSDDDSEFSSSEESVIMLTYPDRHQPRSLSAMKDVTDVASINSQNQSEHIDIIHDNDMGKILSEVRGCFIHKCRITQSKGAVMVSLQAHAIVMECEINSVGYGMRCIQNSRTVVLKNEIHHCRTSGVYMRLAASGLITGNDIHSNCEAGIDIRKNADPIVQCNRIHHGKRSGVVVLGSGRGQIRHNDIYQNKEAGVYILFRGNPNVCNNQIYSGKAAGIAVNEGGRGYIHGNVITGNQWGGIDIRHGGDPMIYQNTVCNGISDGIVIGEGGKGAVQNNIITGNAGCGVWVMGAQQPLIHGNEIHSNRDTGICLVNRMDNNHRNETLAAETKDTPSQASMDFLDLSKEEMTSHRHVAVATVEYNKIYNNEGHGISVQFNEAVIVDSNTVHENKSGGILVDQQSPVTVSCNCVTFNSGSGVVVLCETLANIHGNGIYDNKEDGIRCQSEAEIEENDILGNNAYAIHLKHAGKIRVRQNRLHSASNFLLHVVKVPQCEVVDNLFYSNSDKTVCSDEGSVCTATNNQILPAPPTKTDGYRRRDLIDSSPLGSTRWVLTDPAPRPHVTEPPQLGHAPNQHITAITRVTVPADNCEQGSKFCVIV